MTKKEKLLEDLSGWKEAMELCKKDLDEYGDDGQLYPRYAMAYRNAKLHYYKTLLKVMFSRS